MRTYTIVFALALIAATGACQNEPAEGTQAANPADDAADAACDLVGSWEMISMTATYADGTVETYDETERPTLKILNDTHWMFIRQSGEEFVTGQGGPYTLSDSTYSETVLYSAEPENIGNTYEFTCRVEGDTWYHIGGMETVQFNEVWRRVE